MLRLLMARPKLPVWIKREKLDLTVIETNSNPCSTLFGRLQKPAQILRAYGQPFTRTRAQSQTSCSRAAKARARLCRSSMTITCGSRAAGMSISGWRRLDSRDAGLRAGASPRASSDPVPSAPYRTDSCAPWAIDGAAKLR